MSCSENSQFMGEAVSNEELEQLDCYVDLHLHLDGSLSVNMVKQLASEQGIDLPYSDAEIAQMLQVDDGCNDLNEYLTKFDFPNRFLQSEAGLSRAVELLGYELSEQGVMYAEVRFAPQKHCEQGLTQRQVVSAAISGAQKSPIPLTLILCCMRGDDNHTENVETVNVAAEFLGKGVGAVDLAGAEALFSTANFRDIFALATEKGVPFTIHAGEACGPESVYKALEYGAKRIGHGVRSTEDVRLMERLAKEGIVLECCPTSNLNTAIYDSLADYPYRKFFDAGVKFTINTDNMSVSNTTIKREFIKLNNVFGITPNELKELMTNAVNAAFATNELKETLKDRIYNCCIISQSRE